MRLVSESVLSRRLTLLYCAALGTVALLCITGQVLVQELISQQRSDSSVINVAGRQRMLSQRMSKAALAATRSTDPAELELRRQELEGVLKLWVASHDVLLGKEGHLRDTGSNSPEVLSMFVGLESGRQAMVAACENLLSQLANTPLDREALESAAQVILENEADFLHRMDEIVFQYEAEARARVDGLRRVELVLLAFTLTVLALEGAFVFRPAVNYIRQSMRMLAASEVEREQIAAQLGTIFDTVPALILYHDRDGKIIRVNKSGAEIIGESLYKLHGSSVYAWFSEDAERLSLEDEWIYQHDAPRLGLLHNLRNSQGETRWLRMNKVPYHDMEGNVIGIIVFAVDVTAHKRLEKRLMELRAEEQRRLGYDLHDGLGQHLSGILYLSRRLENRLRGKEAPETDSAVEIVNLVKEAIETVRSMSHGLRPLSEDPRALAAALTELARKTKDTTGIECTFTETGTVYIFENDVAEHLFRIAQEAINNAVRHSQCKHIAVSLRQGDDATTLEITDDGKGLKDKEWRISRPHGREPGGLGLSIMEHRAELMGGSFAIETSEGDGTTVRCTLRI
ncbi:MAG: hypothetical protein RLZZ303_142 [Candidatus Hydrogenedentota bacterium]|jgi:PAS domain S-box-containing protein